MSIIGDFPKDKAQSRVLLYRLKNAILESKYQIVNPKDSESIKVLENAAIPIIKLKDWESSVSIDLSFNTDRGVQTVKLVQKYLEDYPCLMYLVFVLKQFLLQRDLNEVWTGGLSSYSLVLLVVSFLQNLDENTPKPGDQRSIPIFTSQTDRVTNGHNQGRPSQHAPSQNNYAHDTPHKDGSNTSKADSGTGTSTSKIFSSSDMPLTDHSLNPSEIDATSHSSNNHMNIMSAAAYESNDHTAILLEKLTAQLNSDTYSNIRGAPGDSSRSFENSPQPSPPRPTIGEGACEVEQFPIDLDSSSLSSFQEDFSQANSVSANYDRDQDRDIDRHDLPDERHQVPAPNGKTGRNPGDFAGAHGEDRTKSQEFSKKKSTSRMHKVLAEAANRKDHLKFSYNKQNLGILLTQFFELYGKIFNYNNMTISVRGKGSYISKTQMSKQMSENFGQNVTAHAPFESDVNMNHNPSQRQTVDHNNNNNNQNSNLHSQNGPGSGLRANSKVFNNSPVNKSNQNLSHNPMANGHSHGPHGINGIGTRTPEPQTMNIAALEPGLLSIEDPLLLSNDVGKGSYAAGQVRQAFEYAYRIIHRAIFQQPKNRNCPLEYKNRSTLSRIIRITDEIIRYRQWIKNHYGDEMREYYKLNSHIKLVDRTETNLGHSQIAGSGPLDRSVKDNSPTESKEKEENASSPGPPSVIFNSQSNNDRDDTNRLVSVETQSETVVQYDHNNNITNAQNLTTNPLITNPSEGLTLHSNKNQTNANMPSQTQAAQTQPMNISPELLLKILQYVASSKNDDKSINPNEMANGVTATTTNNVSENTNLGFNQEIQSFLNNGGYNPEMSSKLDLQKILSEQQIINGQNQTTFTATRDLRVNDNAKGQGQFSGTNRTSPNDNVVRQQSSPVYGFEAISGSRSSPVIKNQAQGQSQNQNNPQNGVPNKPPNINLGLNQPFNHQHLSNLLQNNGVVNRQMLFQFMHQMQNSGVNPGNNQQNVQISINQAQNQKNQMHGMRNNNNNQQQQQQQIQMTQRRPQDQNQNNNQFNSHSTLTVVSNTNNNNHMNAARLTNSNSRLSGMPNNTNQSQNIGNQSNQNHVNVAQMPYSQMKQNGGQNNQRPYNNQNGQNHGQNHGQNIQNYQAVIQNLPGLSNPVNGAAGVNELASLFAYNNNQQPTQVQMQNVQQQLAAAALQNMNRLNYQAQSNYNSQMGNPGHLGQNNNNNNNNNLNQHNATQMQNNGQNQTNQSYGNHVGQHTGQNQNRGQNQTSLNRNINVNNRNVTGNSNNNNNANQTNYINQNTNQTDQLESSSEEHSEDRSQIPLPDYKSGSSRYGSKDLDRRSNYGNRAYMDGNGQASYYRQTNNNNINNSQIESQNHSHQSQSSSQNIGATNWQRDRLSRDPKAEQSSGHNTNNRIKPIPEPQPNNDPNQIPNHSDSEEVLLSEDSRNNNNNWEKMRKNPVGKTLLTSSSDEDGNHKSDLLSVPQGGQRKKSKSKSRGNSGNRIQEGLDTSSKSSHNHSGNNHRDKNQANQAETNQSSTANTSKLSSHNIISQSHHTPRIHGNSFSTASNLSNNKATHASHAAGVNKKKSGQNSSNIHGSNVHGTSNLATRRNFVEKSGMHISSITVTRPAVTNLEGNAQIPTNSMNRKGNSMLRSRSSSTTAASPRSSSLSSRIDDTQDDFDEDEIELNEESASAIMNHNPEKKLNLQVNLQDSQTSSNYSSPKFSRDLESVGDSREIDRSGDTTGNLVEQNKASASSTHHRTSSIVSNSSTSNSNKQNSHSQFTALDKLDTSLSENLSPNQKQNIDKTNSNSTTRSQSTAYSMTTTNTQNTTSTSKTTERRRQKRNNPAMVAVSAMRGIIPVARMRVGGDNNRADNRTDRNVSMTESGDHSQKSEFTGVAHTAHGGVMQKQEDGSLSSRARMNTSNSSRNKGVKKIESSIQSSPTLNTLPVSARSNEFGENWTWGNQF